MSNSLKNNIYIDVDSIVGVLAGTLPRTTAVAMERQPGKDGRIVANSYIAFDQKGNPIYSPGGKLKLNTRYTRVQQQAQQLANVLREQREPREEEAPNYIHDDWSTIPLDERDQF